MSHSLRYRPDIDGLRGVAVLAVLVFHLDRAWLPGGFVGVDVFFVISGYLITSIIVRANEAESFSYWRFYQRRIARLFPALLAMVLVTLVVAKGLYTSWDFANNIDKQHYCDTMDIVILDIELRTVTKQMNLPCDALDLRACCTSTLGTI